MSRPPYIHWLNLFSTESLVSMCFLLTYLLHVTGVVEYRSLTDLVHQMSLRIHSVESINYWENLFNWHHVTFYRWIQTYKYMRDVLVSCKYCGYYLGKGPSLYYVSEFLDIFDPNHYVSNTERQQWLSFSDPPTQSFCWRDRWIVPK